MPRRKRYKAYLWDPTCEIPARTKLRVNERTRVNDDTSSDSAASDCDVECGLDMELDVSNQPRIGEPELESPENITASATDETCRDAEDIAANIDCRSSSPRPGELQSTDDDSSETSSDDEDPNTTSETGHMRTAPSPGVDDQDDRLYPGCQISQAESLLLVMGHSLRHHSTKEATESFLNVIEAHLPTGTAFPVSKYLFYQQFSGCKKLASLHFYCPESVQYIGTVRDSDIDVQCPTCPEKHLVASLMKSGNYFIMLDVEAQCRDVLESPESSISLKEKKVSFDVCDISLSKGYNALPLRKDDISVTWNTDGVPLFESSKFSVWPLQLQINELPLRERLNSMLLGGLWFGMQKPNMNCFLQPFVQEMNRLSSVGFKWTDPNGSSRHTRVFPGPCSVDTVARCMIMNMTQFNGAYGCAWCEQKGEVVEKGKGHSRVFPTGTKETQRTQESFERRAKKAEERGTPCRGIRGESILLLLAFFSIPSGFVVDYMHAVCSGFVKYTACMWFDYKSSFPFSLKNKIPDVDCRLLGLQPIYEMSRLPRSLAHRKYWKSSEWRNWLLYFSPVVLRGILPAAYYKNWMKFVQIMHFLLMESIPLDQLPQVGKNMTSFLKEYESLYGKQHITYNAHLLLHLVDSVKEWGPLWNYSAYSFENMNGQIVQFVNGTRFAQWQIVDKFLIMSALPKLCRNNFFSMQPSVKALMTCLLKKYSLRKFSSRSHGCVFHGKGQVLTDGISFNKVTINGVTFCVQNRDKSRRLNSYVEAVSRGGARLFGRIVLIRSNKCEHDSCNCENSVFFDIQELKVRSVSLVDINHHVCIKEFVSVELTDDIVHVSSFSVKKCVALKVNGSLFLCSVNPSYMFEAV